MLDNATYHEQPMDQFEPEPESETPTMTTPDSIGAAVIDVELETSTAAADTGDEETDTDADTDTDIENDNGTSQSQQQQRPAKPSRKIMEPYLANECTLLVYMVLPPHALLSPETEIAFAVRSHNEDPLLISMPASTLLTPKMLVAISQYQQQLPALAQAILDKKKAETAKKAKTAAALKEKEDAKKAEKSAVTAKKAKKAETAAAAKTVSVSAPKIEVAQTTLL